jgi:hypothetical protein
MNYKLSQVFVTNDFVTTGATSALAAQKLAFYKSNFANFGSLSAADESDFMIAMGTGSSKFGSFKTSLVKQDNIISVKKTVPSGSATQQITYLGYDESSAATPVFKCGEEYTVTLRVDEYWSKGIYQPIIQDSVTIKTTCCDECSGTDCNSLSAETYIDAIVADINANPLLSKYVLAAKVGSGSNWGVKLTGKAVDEFGNECVPDAVPYVFNLVRFKAYVHPVPATTQDFDLASPCAPWAITTTQEIAYPIGAGPAMAEMERHLYANNLPNVHEARRYWNPIYNNDSDTFLFVDKTKTYNMYEITYADPSPVGFEKKSTDVFSAIVLIDTTLTSEISAFEAQLNYILPTKFHV